MIFEAFTQTAPEALAGLRALSQAASSGLADKGLIELMKIRASQMNGCAFCTQFHLNTARKLGVEPRKLDLVAVWRDAGLFSAREQAALAWTERLTAPGAGTEAGRAALADEFSETEITALTLVIATINAWNRVAGGLGFPPPG
jgi:AhpD family alkylhydroperoxidase